MVEAPEATEVLAAKLPDGRTIRQLLTDLLEEIWRSYLFLDPGNPLSTPRTVLGWKARVIEALCEAFPTYMQADAALYIGKADELMNAAIKSLGATP